jgi:hypothetical protein
MTNRPRDMSTPPLQRSQGTPASSGGLYLRQALLGTPPSNGILQALFETLGPVSRPARDSAAINQGTSIADEEALADAVLEEQEADCSDAETSDLASRIDAFDERLEKIESMLTQLIQQRTVKEWYSTSEVADILGKAEFTVREWCRLDRINAEKRMSGRGAFQDWVIGHAELLRYQKEGLLPLKP